MWRHMKTKNKHYHLEIQKLKLEAQKEVKLDQSTQDNMLQAASTTIHSHSSPFRKVAS